jgi:hypothetical protein
MLNNDEHLKFLSVQEELESSLEKNRELKLRIGMLQHDNSLLNSQIRDLRSKFEAEVGYCASVDHLSIICCLQKVLLRTEHSADLSEHLLWAQSDLNRTVQQFQQIAE